MSEKVDVALKRLNDILPLVKNLQRCDKQVRNLHRQILFSFITNGHILSKADMSTHVSNIEIAIRLLSSSELVLFSSSGKPVGAYPFTMEGRDYKVLTNGFEVNAMCALDALAISPMFKLDTVIKSHCLLTSEPIHIEQSGTKIINLDNSHQTSLCIDWSATKKGNTCSDTLCTKMFFTKNNHIANNWQQINSENREVFSLDEAIEFASRFFLPLVEKTDSAC